MRSYGKLVLVQIVIALLGAGALPAQSIQLSGGIGASHVPRAGQSICGNGRDDLKSPALIGRVGMSVGRFSVGVVGDYTKSLGLTKAYYDCFFPDSGVYTRRDFKGPEESASSISIDARASVQRNLFLSLEAGRTLGHAWHFGPGAGFRLKPLVLGMQIRRYIVEYDEVTTQYTKTGATELNRSLQSESSWGWIVRFAYETR